jgi:hypothetical protein
VPANSSSRLTNLTKVRGEIIAIDLGCTARKMKIFDGR